MPDVIAWIVARVRALLPEHWHGTRGARFKRTLKLFSKAVTDTLPPQHLPDAAVEGAKRYAIGKVSREHAEALKNYAEAENARIRTELERRTLEQKVRQEIAKATQEESRARNLQADELFARLKLFDEFQRLGVVPIWNRDGNVTFVKAPVGTDWTELRDRIFDVADLTPILADGDREQQPRTKKTAKRRKRRRR